MVEDSGRDAGPARQAAHADRISGLPLGLRWAGVGAVGLGVLGGLAGLVIGLRAHPATAGIAVVELGSPAAFLGAWIGLLAGGVVSLVHNRADTGKSAHRLIRRDAIIASIVMVGASCSLSALQWMTWARLQDPRGQLTFRVGPTRVLALGAAASIVFAIIVVLTRWTWRWLILTIVTLVAAVAAATVALSSIAAANHARSIGPAVTSYQPGAAVGVVAATVMVAGAVIGLVMSREQPATAPAVSPEPS